MKLRATINDTAIRNLAERFPKEAPAMISRAVNKTGTFARKRVVQVLREHINVKAGDLKRRNVILKRGTRMKPGATITISGARIPLIYFAARQTKSGVTYKVSPKEGRKRIRESFISSVSYGTGKFREAVFARKTKKRLPIAQLFGPSVPHVMVEEKITIDLKDEIRKRLEKEAASQVEYVLSKKK